jgi:predicted unusual protein kinase regulating ubiquinone biosynthesis (AarF/ABC1/UbiB family)
MKHLVKRILDTSRWYKLFTSFSRSNSAITEPPWEGWIMLFSALFFTRHFPQSNLPKSFRSTAPTALHKIFLAFFILLASAYLPTLSQAQDNEADSEIRNSSKELLEKALENPKLAERLESRIANYRKSKLPGGVFFAPSLYREVSEIAKQLQKTSLVSSNAYFALHLASTPVVNAWVSNETSISEIKVYHIVVTKGFLDLISNTPWAQRVLGPELAETVYKNSKAVLANVIGHEMGHAMHGDTENPSATIRVYHEFMADEFGVKVANEAGYDPKAAILMQQTFQKLTEGNESEKRLFQQLLDEHPKSKFRIAALEELVSLLSHETQARKQFNAERKEARPRRKGQLNRNGYENPSKNSYSAIQKALQKPEYQDLNLEEKFVFLERYFFLQEGQLGPMSGKAIVEVVKEYDRLLNDRSNLEEISDLIESLKRFEKNLGQLKSLSGADQDSDVKSALRALRGAITEKQKELLSYEFSSLMDRERMQELANRYDKAIVLGSLQRAVSKTQDTRKLRDLIFLLQNTEFLLNRRLQWNRSTEGKFFKNNRSRLLERIVVRHLHLTKDMESTLDFMQRVLPVEKKKSGTKVYKIVSGFSYMMAGLLRYAIYHPGLEWGRLTERLSQPTTAEDKLYSVLIDNLKQEIDTQLKNRLNLERTVDPFGSKIRYGLLTSRHWNPDAFTKDLIFLLQFSVTNNTFNGIANEFIQTHFTLEETLDLLKEKGSSKGWNSLAPEILNLDQSRSHRDLESNLRRIERALMLLEPSFKKYQKPGIQTPLKRNQIKSPSFSYPNGSLEQDLLTVYRSAIETRKEKVEAMVEKVIQTRTLYNQHKNVQKFQRNLNVPMLTESHIKTLDTQNRIDLFNKIARADWKDHIETHFENFLNSRQAFEAALNTLVKNEKINETLRNELLTRVDRIIDLGRDSTVEELLDSKEFFTSLRELRDYLHILKNSSVKLNNILTTSDLRHILYFPGMNRGRITQPTFASEWITRFLTGTSKNVENYLEAASKNLPEAKTYLNSHQTMLRAYAESIAHYEGTAKVEMFSNKAKLLTALMQASNTWSNDNFQMNIDYNQYLNERDLRGLDIEKGMQTFIEKEANTQNHKELLESFVEYRIQNIWSQHLLGSYDAKDPVQSLIYALSYMDQHGNKNEAQTRLAYVLLMGSLTKVKNKSQMDAYTATLALYLKGSSLGHNLLGEVLSSNNLNSFAKINATRYREAYYNKLAEMLDHHKSWTSASHDKSSLGSKFLSRVYGRLHTTITNFKEGSEDNFIFRMLNKVYVMREVALPFLINSKWYTSFFEKAEGFILKRYTKVAFSGDLNNPAMSHKELLLKLRENTPWSEKLDQMIFEIIRDNRVSELGLRKIFPKTRDASLELVKQIRSMNLREKAYREILERHGHPKDGLWARAKANLLLLRKYREAEVIWTKEVLERLEQTQTILEAWKIKNKAWEEHVKKRAQDKGMGQAEADQLLSDLYEAYKKSQSPFAGEVAEVFPEASRHRDALLEEFVKNEQTTFEDLSFFEGFKSYESESPYHKIAKAVFELVDTKLEKLLPSERAELALYLSGHEKELSPRLKSRFRKLVYGNRKRKKLLKEHGVILDPQDLRRFFELAHPEEKTVAFRALFVGKNSIASDRPTMDALSETLFLSDPEMPKFLRKVIKIYLSHLTRVESAVYFSWLLAHGDQGRLKGPEIVRLMIEKGGVAAAKLAQLIASHGFRLPEAYQGVLESFKGEAQNIDKIEFMRALSRMLPEKFYSQIKSLDHELGSGSIKIAYSATLNDGRKVVLKMARSHIYSRTGREFELLNKVTEEIMKDPSMKVQNLPELVTEVERIIREEMNFHGEQEKIQQHRRAVNERPLLVKLLGNKFDVYVPKPYTEWAQEGLVVEEFVKAKTWSELPAYSVTGWSREKLAKASINEILNQMLLFVEPKEYQNSKVILDIDPHEENQMAQRTHLGLKKALVNIDLGQSVDVDPKTVRGLFHAIFFIDRGQIDNAVEKMRDYMVFENTSQTKLFERELRKQAEAFSDPLEILTKTLEEVELEGVALKSEYLFFQKLFATAVGLKKHVRSKHYMTRQAKKILLVRFASNPLRALHELRELNKEKRAIERRPFKPSQLSSGKIRGSIGPCRSLFGGM